MMGSRIMRVGVLGLVVMLVGLGGCKAPVTTTTETDTNEDNVVVETQVDAMVILDTQPLDEAFAFNPAIDPEHAAKARKLLDGAMRYLIEARDTDGAWSMNYEGQQLYQPALTAMIVKPILADPRFDIDSPVVKNAYDVLLSYQKADGGIYERDKGNYSTSLAVMALAPAAAADEQYRPAMDNAVGYLRGCQINVGAITPSGDPIEADHPYGGGVSYGDHNRPDLSNVGMWMEAMHDAGVEGSDPALQNALAFVTRTQNSSETNTATWAVEGPNDGGMVYAPALGDDLMQGESKAGPAADGGLRSYGSMTYIGFMSMLYADVDKTDPRVRGAYNWIRRYWTLDSNPNMPHLRSEQGLYYYYQVFAKALRANGEAEIVDLDGTSHNWREELIDALADRVNEDGSWVGDPRWFEGDPVLVTGYVLNALHEATAP
jgi:squalene-hopene/tetraprenyl-beta-curcumene cyclase